MPSTPLPLGIQANTGLPLSDISSAALDSLSKGPLEPGLPGVDPADRLDAKLGVDDGINWRNLDETGWGVLFGNNVPKEYKEALQPLLDKRYDDCHRNDKLFKVFDGDKGGYRTGDSAEDWAKRINPRIEMGPVKPSRGVPFYILIVADANDIPYEFQYSLDMNWGVGRVWFNSADEVRQYAASVVAYETTGVPTTRQMAVFSPRNDNDAATGVLHDFLVQPMLHNPDPIGDDDPLLLQPFLEGQATAEQFAAILQGKIDHGPPALLFTGSHGMAFQADDDHLRWRQGSIVLQGWQGGRAPARSEYFPAKDIPDDAKVHGMIHFQFACYGMGWPAADSYNYTGDAPETISNWGPGVARFPQCLCSHANGGALASLGHIDRAYTGLFLDTKDLANPDPAAATPQLDGLTRVLNRLVHGERVGWATDQMNLRWASLSVPLSQQLAFKANKHPSYDPDRLRDAWIARDDARNYVVFGDPAVRLRSDLLTAPK